MELSSLLSDDQIAVAGCFAALAVCGAIAAISFQLGPANKSQTRASVPFQRPGEKPSSDPVTRKAA